MKIAIDSLSSRLCRSNNPVAAAKTAPELPWEIVAENLHISFGDNHVLRGIDLSVRRGELVAVVGGSGCGKTVLLNVLMGQLRPDLGSVLLADHEAAGSPLINLAHLDNEAMDHIRHHWGVVFQRNALLSGTVSENIELPLMWVKHLEADEVRQRVRKAVQAVGLDADTVLPLTRDELSGGMAKRVAIARALALEPLLIFYDEPTAGLDPEHISLLHGLIMKTHSARIDGGARTSFIITHDKELLYRLQPRIIMLHEGKVFFDGSYDRFIENRAPVMQPYLKMMPVLNSRPVHADPNRI